MVYKYELHFCRIRIKSFYHFPDNQMEKAMFASMPGEGQADHDLQAQIEKNVETTMLKKGTMESNGLWPEKRIYYTFSPRVGK